MLFIISSSNFLFLFNFTTVDSCIKKLLASFSLLGRVEAIIWKVSGCYLFYAHKRYSFFMKVYIFIDLSIGSIKIYFRYIDIGFLKLQIWLKNRYFFIRKQKEYFYKITIRFLKRIDLVKFSRVWRHGQNSDKGLKWRISISEPDS